jgi:hypothetical protein
MMFNFMQTKTQQSVANPPFLCLSRILLNWVCLYCSYYVLVRSKVKPMTIKLVFAASLLIMQH